jgi:hypothetical protein
MRCSSSWMMSEGPGRSPAPRKTPARSFHASCANLSMVAMRKVGGRSYRSSSTTGRRFVGIMAQSHTPTTANVHTSAALLQAPAECPLDPGETDAFWTLVAYHNSLRELGKTVTLMRDDVPARMAVIARTEESTRIFDGDDEMIELTSNISAAAIPRNLERLKATYGSKGCVAVVACTNMISVGVDVSRLGLMMVNGQPKATSEYIQATSRVGRAGPGLIVALYSAAKPRDRSHYESFRHYHESLYRQVEPTSVTPFALPARIRALHAALVILARFCVDLPGNDAAAQFRPDGRLDDILAALEARVRSVDEREVDDTLAHLQLRVAEWMHRRELGEGTGGLRYYVRGKQHVSLMRRFDEAGDAWPTLDSMRNVDVECLIRVHGEDS